MSEVPLYGLFGALARGPSRAGACPSSRATHVQGFEEHSLLVNSSLRHDRDLLELHEDHVLDRLEVVARLDVVRHACGGGRG